MKYEKAMAEVILFDNSDVITASAGDCDKGQSKRCNGGTGGNSGNCKGSNVRLNSACPNEAQRSARGSAGDFFSRDTGWL